MSTSQLVNKVLSASVSKDSYIRENYGCVSGFRLVLKQNNVLVNQEVIKSAGNK